MNINQEGNRPKLKKIKRPINRTMPVGEKDIVVQSSSSVQSQGVKAVELNNAHFSQDSGISALQRMSSQELNEYLDDEVDVLEDQGKAKDVYPAYISEEDYYNKPVKEIPKWLSLKIFVSSVVAVFVLGIIIGKVVLSQSAVVHNGLQGVVINSEVPRGRARCGIAERSQGCVLYIMNPQRQEMSAKDFYDLASQLTGRQRFMIETGNMRYANSRIKPGEIVQLNIPPL